MRRHGLVVACAIIGISGCSSEPPPPYPVWSRPSKTNDADASDVSAFAHLIRAAELAEKSAAKMMDRVFFTPAQRESLSLALGPAIKEIELSSREPVQFEFQTTNPFGVQPFQSGWRAIARVLTWRIDEVRENASATPADLDRAISAAVLGTKLGFDITGGGATEAALGFGIVDEIRCAIAPMLPRFGAEQLGRLGDSITKSFRHRPPLSETLNHEKLQMLARVQAVQDAYVHNDFSELRTQLGADGREAVHYLTELRKRDSTERPKYFKSFAAEAEAETRAVSERIDVPAVKREKFADRTNEFRPWKRLSRHFFETGRPLLDWNDRTCARTRLLILECLILKSIKTTQAAPKNLTSVPFDLRLDPYNGASLRYATSGQDYRVYSVGANGIDDGGDTDDAWLAPDLVLEVK